MTSKKNLIDVTMGRTSADLAIVNAHLLNVYTGEILDNHSVCTKGERIAYVGPNHRHAMGQATEVIDAKGATLIPGLIDGHGHIAWLYTAGEFLKYAARGGTTTIITETLEVYPVAGLEGILDFLASLKNQPIKFFATATAMVSISQAAMGIDLEELETLLKRDDIVGLGESYWQTVMQHSNVFFPIFERTLAHGKTLEGHSAGAGGKKLQAYTACGVSSCHEPITPEEVLERLRLGVYVMLREGSVRRDLSELSKIREFDVDTRRLILTPDGITPDALMERGYMEFLVQKAIDSGFDPVTAVQMATLNVAEHFNLDDRIGGIAPGKYADLVLVPDPSTIKALCVVSSGRIIARNGNLEVTPRKHSFTAKSLNSMKLPQKIEPSAFTLNAKDRGDSVNISVIEMVTDLVTRRTVMSLPVAGGEIRPDPENDLVKIAAIDRTKHPGKCFTGLIKGFGLKSGAMASSAAWDTSCVIVVGADEGDMACAVNKIQDLQGGAVISTHGEIAVALALPVFGIISELPMEDLADKIKAFKGAAKSIGVSFPDPLLTLITLTGAAIPFLRICEEGLVDLKDGKLVDLFMT